MPVRFPPRGNTLGREAHGQVNMAACPVEFGQFHLEAGARIPEDFLRPHRVPGAEHTVPAPGHGHQVRVEQKDALPAGADFP